MRSFIRARPSRMTARCPWSSSSRHLQFERRQDDVDLVAVLVGAVEAAVGSRVHADDMVAVIREGLAGRQPRTLADDFIAFGHEPGPVRIEHDPFAAEESDHPIGAVQNRDVVDERVWLVRWEARATMMVAELFQRGGEAGQGTG